MLKLKIYKAVLKFPFPLAALTVCLFFFISFDMIAQQAITIVRQMPVGSNVTTTGTVSSGAEWGQLRYIQDADAGIAVYGSSVTTLVPGDSVTLSGKLSLYKGELQISPVTNVELISAGHSLKTIVAGSFADFDAEMAVSRKIQLGCLGIKSCESFFSDGKYCFFDGKGHCINGVVLSGSGLINKAVPTGAVFAEGIWTQSNSGFQISLQDIGDATESDCGLVPVGTVDLPGGELYITWYDVLPLASWAEWGVEPFSEIESVTVQAGTVSFHPSGLIPGQLYNIRLKQITQSGDTIYSPSLLVASPAEEDPVEVYFDRNINTSYSDGSAPEATGTSVIEVRVIALIDQTKSSLDIAMYNNGRATIVQAINRAKNRGVRVRYIAEGSTSNTALGSAGFPVFYRDGDGIMHNKFMIGDAEDPASAWLWTGSTNFTSGQLTSDPNHACVVHDQAMALNYRREFDEMWGALPDHTDAKIGEEKTDNTAHTFFINGDRVDAWFSPSDEVDCQIRDAIASADHQLLAGLLLLTSEDLTDELIDRYMAGVDVRVIIDDDGSSASSIARLAAAGIPYLIHTPSAIFHHKYAIVDEGYADSDPLVVSGSHNWTWSADHINDENTLIYHSQRMANIFRQEYEARWAELGGTAVGEPSLTSIWLTPNPATTFLELQNPFPEESHFMLYTSTGILLDRRLLAADEHLHYNLPVKVGPGLFLVQMRSREQIQSAFIVIER